MAGAAGLSVRTGTKLVHEHSYPCAPPIIEAAPGRFFIVDTTSGELVRYTPPDHLIPLGDWKVNLHPSVGEATISYAPIREATDDALKSGPSEELDPIEREIRNHLRSARRSRTHSRRFIIDNRLTKLWVLTFAEGLHGVDGYFEAMRRVSVFVRWLRRNYFRDKPFPYWYGIEPHPQGHGWHVNLLLQSVYIDKHQFQRGWRHGNVWFSDFATHTHEPYTGRKLGRGGRPGGDAAGRNAREAARRAAAYAAKYCTKDWQNPELYPQRAHRYECAQGFQPRKVEHRARTLEDAAAFLRSHPSFGTETFESDSSTWRDYDGPPVTVVWFDPPSNARRPRRRAPT